MPKTKVALPCGACERVFVRPKRLKNHIATQHPEIAMAANMMYHGGVAGGDRNGATARKAAVTPSPTKRKRRQRRRTAPPERGPDPNKLYLVPIGAGSVSQGGKGKARGEVIDLRSVSPPVSVAEVSPQRTTPRWCTVNGPVVAKSGPVKKSKGKGKEKLANGHHTRRGSTPTPSSARYHPYPPATTHLPTRSEHPSSRFKRGNSVASVQAYSEPSNDGRKSYPHYHSDDELDDRDDGSSVDLDAMSIPDVLGRSDTPEWSERYTPSEGRTATPAAKRAFTVDDDSDSEDERVRWKRPRVSPYSSEDASSAASSRYASIPPNNHSATTEEASSAPSASSISSANPDNSDHTSRAPSSPTRSFDPVPQPQPELEPEFPRRADSFQRFMDHAVALPSTTYRTTYTAIPAASSSRAHVVPDAFSKENGASSNLAARSKPNPRAARVSPAPDDDDTPLLPPTTSAMPLSSFSTHHESGSDVERDGTTTPSSPAANAATDDAASSQPASTPCPTPHRNPASLGDSISVPPAPSATLASFDAEAIPVPRVGTPHPPALPTSSSMVSSGTQTDVRELVPAPPNTSGALTARPRTEVAVVAHGLRRCEAATCGLCHPLAHALHSVHSALSWFSWKCEEP